MLSTRGWTLVVRSAAMSRCAVVLALLTAGCGARSSFGLSFGPEPDAGSDAAVDAAVDAGPGCGFGPACSAGSYCCATEACVPAGHCCLDEDCEDGFACLPGGGCGVGDLGCGLDELVPDVRPADVMLMLDRSESMYEQIGGETKWALAASSLHQVLPDYDGVGGLRFGLTMFPGPVAECQTGLVSVDLADGNAGPILDVVDGTAAGQGGTPIADTLEHIGSDGGLDDPTHGNFVLLLSDGSETCLGHPATVAADLYDRTPPIQVYVVGFGHRADPGVLGEIAQASHTESGTARGYWSAEDANQLTDAFDSIPTSVIQCEFLLPRVPPDPDRVYAFLGEEAVARDPTNGFEVDPESNRLTFFGDACAAVRTESSSIRVVYGCPPED